MPIPPALFPAMVSALGLLLAALPAVADIHPFPSTQSLVAGQLQKREFGAGIGWSGLSSGYSNQFALYGSYGLLEPLDLSLALIPAGDGAFLAGGEILYTPWQGEAWSGGASLSGYFPLGETETFHFDHGNVRHAVTSLRLGAECRWKWVYFGAGYLHARDDRTYLPTALPVDSRAGEFAREYPEYSLGGVQERLGILIGDPLRFKLEMSILDPRFYNLLIEPSDPISAAGMTLSAGVTYTFGHPAPGRNPANARPPPFASPPDTASRDGWFDVPQYWRGVRYGALAGLAGLLAGAALGAAQDEEEFYILPPEMMYALAGAVVTVPVGSVYGVLTDPHRERKARATLWTLGGTAAGFATAVVLAPVTAGASFFFLTPLGSAMGFHYGAR